MSARRGGWIVLAVQLAIVLSIGAKYAWERHHCPMVWARAGQYDPDQPIRGRYIALTLHANACGLPDGDEGLDLARRMGRLPPSVAIRPLRPGPREWRVVPAVRDGQLTPRVVDDAQPGPTQMLTLQPGIPCEYASLIGPSEFFIPEHAKSPLPLQKGQELWALVTVPPSGPVRPVKLAISDAQGFHVLTLD